jgi:hypothetical protein
VDNWKGKDLASDLFLHRDLERRGFC